MAKRSGLMRVAAKPHKPGDAGGYKRSSLKILKKKKVRTAKATTKVNKVAAAAASSAAVDDMFALGISTSPKKRKDDQPMREAPIVPELPAFEDDSKAALFRSILQASKNADVTSRIPADEHRELCNSLKRKKAERAALRAERFAQHKKC